MALDVVPSNSKPTDHDYLASLFADGDDLRPRMLTDVSSFGHGTRKRLQSAGSNQAQRVLEEHVHCWFYEILDGFVRFV